MNNVSLKKFTYHIRIKGRKRHRVQKLLFETINYLLTIDTALRTASKKANVNLSNLSTMELNLLRILTYRILFNNYELSQIRTKTNNSKLINKIISHINFPTGDTDIDRLALRYSFPRWMIKNLINRIDNNTLELLLDSLNKRPTKWIAININRISPDEAIESLNKEGFNAEQDEEFKDIAIKISKFSKPLTKTNLYKKGLAIPVSKASIGVVKALKITSGEIILDACAAPGVKTILMNFYLNDSGKIYAIDISPNRLKRMRTLLKLFNINNVILTNADARKIKLEKSFDKVLIDAPCTSSGMIGLSPDIKWRLKPEMINYFSGVQLSIVENIIQQLVNMENKVQIVYSTCSIFPQENEDLVKRILNAYEDVVSIDGKSLYGIGLADYYGKFGKRFYPFIHHTIGLFLTSIIV